MKLMDFIKNNPVFGILPPAVMSIMQFMTTFLNSLLSNVPQDQLCNLMKASSGLETAFLCLLLWLFKGKKGPTDPQV